MNRNYFNRLQKKKDSIIMRDLIEFKSHILVISDYIP